MEQPAVPPVCPLCRVNPIGHPALSRFDNKTEVCSACGLREALGMASGKLRDGMAMAWDDWKRAVLDVLLSAEAFAALSFAPGA
jgi:hypothetical protein